jgi:hypothetical protein
MDGTVDDGDHEPEHTSMADLDDDFLAFPSSLDLVAHEQFSEHPGDPARRLTNLVLFRLSLF